MIKLGEMQELEVVKKQDFGVYLKSSDDVRGDNRILLPIKQVPETTEIGDKINVFVYRDSNDRIIATVNRPKLVIGEIGYLKVVEMSKIGAFLNWGLEKDLFLPFKEQVGELKNGGEYMVGLYVDKSDRLCATMNLFHVLRTDSPYKINDIVKGTVFSLKRGLGAMIAVEGKYLGLIHEGEILKPIKSGDEVELRVSNIKEDGKLDLSFKDAPKLQIDRDGDKIFNALAKNKGRLPLNDDSSPELIIEKLGMSKSSFKKALGRLLKRGIIVITKEGIQLSDKTNNTEKKDYNKKPYSPRKDGGKDYYKKSENSDRRDFNNNYKKSENSDRRDFNNNYKKSENSDRKDFNNNYKKSENSDRKDFNNNYKKSDSSDKRNFKDNFKKSDNSNSDRNKNNSNNKDYYKKDNSPKSNYSKKTNFNKNK
jgi:predicted RNA-binding protein (virulence factor B family)